MPWQQPIWQGVLQLTPQGLLHFGLQKAKKCARLLVQHEPQADPVSQLAEQLPQPPPPQLEWQLIEWQPRPQGSRQSSERKPRRRRSSKHGFGQQLPIDGGGTGVQQPGAAEQPGRAVAQPQSEPPNPFK